MIFFGGSLNELFFIAKAMATELLGLFVERVLNYFYLLFLLKIFKDSTLKFYLNVVSPLNLNQKSD